MICSTNELMNYVNSQYVAKGLDFEGAEFLNRVLFENSEYRDHIYHILGRYNKREIEKIHYLNQDRCVDNNLCHNLISLLKHIKKHQGTDILVKNDKELTGNIKSLRKGRTLNSNTLEKEKPKFFTRFISLKVVGFITLTCLMMVIIIASGNIFNDTNLGYRNIEIARSLSAKDLTDKGYWVVWRTSYKEYKSAVADKNSTREYHPNIHIVKLSDERYHLLEIMDGEIEANNINTIRSKKHEYWARSEVLFISYQKCQILKIDENGYYECF